MFDARPYRGELLDWLGIVDPGTGPDDVYGLALETAVQGQAAGCDVSVYAPALHAAALRRAARFLAARGLALGTLDTGDTFGGLSTIPRWDAEIEALERPFRRGAFA